MTKFLLPLLLSLVGASALTNQVEFTSISATPTNDRLFIRITLTNTVPGIQYEMERSIAGQNLTAGFATFFGFTPTNTFHTLEFFTLNNQPFRFYRVKNL